MKRSSKRKFHNEVSWSAKKGQTASLLTSKKVTEKEILEDFQSFKKARRR